MKRFFLIVLALIVLACGGIEDMPYLTEATQRREEWQKLLDTPSYIETQAAEFAAADLSQLVAEECEPLHTYDAPFCDNPGCACHQDEALFVERIEKPVQSGTMKIWQAQELLWPER